jgi:hypothetical protein
MELDFKNLQMDLTMKENLKMESQMELENIIG